MQQIELSAWEEFEDQVRSLKDLTKASISGLLFRGQDDSSWPLDTTLERSGRRNFPIKDYYRVIGGIKPQIETFTAMEWDNFDYSQIDELLQGYDTFSLRLSAGKVPEYSYMLYLRHHGFPSLLLDWTRSPYIAAYFAFRRPKGKSVSIYVFCDAPENMKFRSSDKPAIHHIGGNVRTHRRNFLQQSGYTICTGFQDQWRFALHTEVFQGTTPDEVIPQDVLWKLNLPSNERSKVLKLLDDCNLNAFSLFGSEESLMEAIAFREMSF